LSREDMDGIATCKVTRGVLDLPVLLPYREFVSDKARVTTLPGRRAKLGA